MVINTNILLKEITHREVDLSKNPLYQKELLERQKEEARETYLQEQVSLIFKDQKHYKQFHEAVLPRQQQVVMQQQPPVQQVPVMQQRPPVVVQQPVVQPVQQVQPQQVVVQPQPVQKVAPVPQVDPKAPVPVTVNKQPTVEDKAKKLESSLKRIEKSQQDPSITPERQKTLEEKKLEVQAALEALRIDSEERVANKRIASDEKHGMKRTVAGAIAGGIGSSLIPGALILGGKLLSRG